MSYKILSTKVNGETLVTEVEYTLKDGNKVTLEVPHFQPDDDASVIEGIENREVSEQRKVDAELKNQTIKVSLDKEIGLSKEATL